MSPSLNQTHYTDDGTGVNHLRTTLRLLFGMIAALALLGNGLVCGVILKSRTMLKNSYNLMILSLAFIDMLTGIILAVTPAFVIGDQNFPVPGHLAGELFCRLVSSQFFLFTFGKISVGIVMLMALDRWYAIARPIKYKASFRRRKVLLYLAGVSVFSCAINWQPLFAKKLSMENSKPSCVWVKVIENKLTSQIFTLVYVKLTFFIPLLVSLVTFIHIWKVMRRSRSHLSRGNRANFFSSVLRMCAITALFMALCWIPNQLVYLLSKFNITQLDTALHHGSVVLAMFNSCLNPWIYGVTNRNYRRKFARILCFWRRVEVGPEDTDITAMEKGRMSKHHVTSGNTEQNQYPGDSRSLRHLSFPRDGSENEENLQKDTRNISLATEEPQKVEQDAV